VKHQPKIAVHANRDALSNPPQLAYDLAFHAAQWRLHRSQQKSARQPHPLQRLPDNPGFQGIDVGSDIGQFRHAPSDCTQQTHFRKFARINAEAGFYAWGKKSYRGYTRGTKFLSGKN
jgi:hypothetical protein